LLFEQKWSDILIGELEAMLSTSFVEQGTLLRKVRIQYAKAFYHLEQLYAERSTVLSSTLHSFHAIQEELKHVEEKHIQEKHHLHQQCQEELEKLGNGFRSEREALQQKHFEAKEQMGKMGDTMKTLNTIFRQMREDTEKVKAVELREQYGKLEKKYELVKEEMERLRPLMGLNETLQEQKQMLQHENQSLRDQLSQVDGILASKDDMIAELMEQHSEFLAAQELRAARDEELKRQAEEDEEDLEEEQKTQLEKGTLHRRNSISVCVRCKQSLREMSEVGEINTSSSPKNASSDGLEISMDLTSSSLIHDFKKKRIPCLYFRILLPNLRGRRPQRELTWTFSCMRAILFAKQLDDTMCQRNGGALTTRIRMPEYVYAWFTPWKTLCEPHTRDDAPEEDGSNTQTIEQRFQQADEDRWCLYYGVKALVQEGYLEAKLFLSLLDEKYGEDEQVFMLYCYRILDSLIGGKLNWGPLRDQISYEYFQKQYEQLYTIPTLEGGKLPYFPKTVWISPYHASLATSIVLSRATDSEREGLQKKLMEFAIINLSEDERPRLYLTPAASTAPKPVKSKHRKRTSVQEDEVEQANETKHLQFIDANLWIEMMMMEYKEEQAHRRAAIRLMFQTSIASSSSLMRSSNSSTSMSMDLDQFRIMLSTLNHQVTSFSIAMLYRNAYRLGNGSVTFDSFMQAAEDAQFFSSCMRLESTANCIARLATNNPDTPSSTVLASTSRVAAMVDKFFTLLKSQVSDMVAVLPLWTRSLTDALSYHIAFSLQESDERLSDGMHLLTLFHRFLDSFLMMTLIKREVTGSCFTTKHIYTLEKTLYAVLDGVRMGEKTA
jgi:hypothetical protein